MRFLFLITFAARTPDEIGNSTGQVWQTCAGVYQGSLLLSTPGQPHMPGSQAVRRCLIVYPDRVNADGHAKDRPRRWHSRSVGALRPVSIGPQGSDVVACAEGRSSVWVVTRTAGILFSKNSSCVTLAVIKA